VGETAPRRRIGDANEVVAGRALDLPSGMAGIALERLITMGTIEFEIGCAHRLYPLHAQNRGEKSMQNRARPFWIKLAQVTSRCARLETLRAAHEQSEAALEDAAAGTSVLQKGPQTVVPGFRVAACSGFLWLATPGCEVIFPASFEHPESRTVRDRPPTWPG